jgi:hypothetical protein
MHLIICQVFSGQPAPAFSHLTVYGGGYLTMVKTLTLVAGDEVEKLGAVWIFQGIALLLILPPGFIKLTPLGLQGHDGIEKFKKNSLLLVDRVAHGKFSGRLNHLTKTHPSQALLYVNQTFQSSRYGNCPETDIEILVRSQEAHRDREKIGVFQTDLAPQTRSIDKKIKKQILP